MVPFTRLAHDEQWGQPKACVWHKLDGTPPQWHGCVGRCCTDEIQLRERWTWGNGDEGCEMRGTSS